MPKLPFSFYQGENVTLLARELLGKQLFTLIDGELTGGTIVETEAYNGVLDKASHAYGGRFTNRTQTMYAPGGLSYVYLCYGIHHLFNVVTGLEDTPHAVLIRGLVPTVGLEVMLRRRNMPVLKPNLTAGPGALAKALGIDRDLNAKDLLGDEIWIEDNGVSFNADQIVSAPRIGVAYADDHALLPWRFYVKGNEFVSKPKT
jgi:DNA-3-methyladenine glycosylase